MFSMESCGRSNSISFGYGNENGPHKWKLLFPESNGCSQSPINIVTRLAVVLQSSEPLKWSGYHSQPTSMLLENDGNSGKIKSKEKKIISLLFSYFPLSNRQ